MFDADEVTDFYKLLETEASIVEGNKRLFIQPLPHDFGSKIYVAEFLIAVAKNRSRAILPLLRRDNLNEHMLLMQEAFADGMLAWGREGSFASFSAISRLYVL